MDAGEQIAMETRLWEEGSQRTISMRAVKKDRDYRYFPEPDLARLKYQLSNTAVAFRTARTPSAETISLRK